MAVITAEGIVGKVIDVYPSSSNVLLVTDASFAAGVKSGDHWRSRRAERPGARNSGPSNTFRTKKKVEQGDWFLTLGQDFVHFPPV